MRALLHKLFSALVTLCIFAALLAGEGAAFAQSANCGQLQRNLRSLTNNRDFRSLEQSQARLRDIQAQLQQVESLFVRGGCQNILNQGGQLPNECRIVARRILSGREDYKKAAASVETGQAVAQQRELTLQQMARFACGSDSRSSATFNNDFNNDDGGSRGNLFDRLFGTGDQFIDDDENWNYGYFGGQTLRTVCVRKCDGYYWPVSFSTVSDYLQDDAAQCQSQCPGAEVELYYYQNPGEQAEDMVNLDGQPYRNLPTAFAYRESYNPACACKKQIDYGSIVINASADGNQSRPVIQFADLSFPLPLRDPRQKFETTLAEVIQVQLPRPRPVREGEPQPVKTVAAPAFSGESRQVEIGGRTVRLVGPDTPYARLGAKGT